MDEEQKKLKDGFSSALGGVDTGLEPALVAPNALAFAVNATLRGGYPSTRPAYVPKYFRFDNTEIQSWWATNIWQDAYPYVAPEADFMLSMVGGRLFKIDPEAGFLITDVTPVKNTATTAPFTSPAVGATVPVDVGTIETMLIGYPATIGDGTYIVTAISGLTVTVQNVNATAGVVVPQGTFFLFSDPNDPTIDTTYFLQAAEFGIVQDGVSLPIIFNGSTSRRAVYGTEIPVATAMAYHNRRIWFAANGNEVGAGDIFELGDHANILKVSEEKVLTGFGRFIVDGIVTAMAVTASLDASLGQGPLLVMTKDTFNSFNLPANRDLWSTITTPIQTIALSGFGPLGQNGVRVVNGDVFYRAKDGLRSFVMARRDFFTWGNVPISSELRRILDPETKYLRRFSSTVLFDNRLLFTVTPFDTTTGTYFKGLAVLDFDLLSQMGKKADPVYDGLWTGLQALKMLVLELNDTDHCFIFTQEPNGKIGLWELSTDGQWDSNDPQNGRIASWVETRAFGFGDNSMFKKLQSLKAWIRYNGTVDITLKWRPDSTPCWFFWDHRQVCNVAESCATGDCYSLKTFEKFYKTRMGFGQPPDVCDGVDQKLARYCYEAQYRIEWIGWMQLRRLLLTAGEFDEHPLRDCD